MTTNKYMRFAAPYRSKTFNDKENFVFGKCGVVSGGDVTQSGVVATIAAPFTFIQNGLIVTVPDVSLSLTVPVAMVAPYFIAVSVSSSIENTSEVITPVLIKRPQDVNSNVVLVAEWDGVEWRNLPKLQMKEINDASATQNIFTGFTGVCAGFGITQDLSSFTVDSGSLIGKDGIGVTKDTGVTLSKTVAPYNLSQAYDRIDSLVFRKPNDSSYRVGTVKAVVGPSFVGTTGTYTETFTTFGASAVTSIKTKDLYGTTKTVMAFKEGTDLKAKVFDETLTELVQFTVATNVIDFQFIGDFTGNLDFVFTDTTTTQTALKFTRTDATGVVLILPTVIYSSLKTLYTPDIICIGKPSEYKLHIAVCKEGSGTDREIGYMRLASDGVTIDTSYSTWINLVANLQRPYLAKDDDDSLIFVGFDNTDNGRAYLYTFDSGTPTSSTPPTIVGSSVELQTDIYNIATATAMPTLGAKSVRIFRTDNKETFVVWLQPLATPGEFGIGVYNYRYMAMFGHKALVFDNTNILDFSADVDGLNHLYAVTLDTAGTTLTKNVYSLEATTRIGTQDTVYTSTGLTETSIKFCPCGDLIYGAGAAATGRWSRSTAAVKTTLREQTLCPTDIYLGYYRTSDSMLSVSDTLVGEHSSVKRLYEFNNLFGAATNISWSLAGANKLVTSAIIIRFLNRQSTYTIAATAPGGVTVPDGYIYYTEIPDEDAITALVTYLEPFGEGVLDRIGKTAVPLFWNIGGTLYSNFSPYSFSATGESAPLGSTISTQLIQWLGTGTSAPDPSNHAYSSTFYILQTDDVNTAIGKLDAAVGAFSPVSVPLTMSTDSISVVFGSPKASANFKLIGQLANITDAAPMIQPVITSARTVNGFTVTWPSPLDSGNYTYEYILHGV